MPSAVAKPKAKPARRSRRSAGKSADSSTRATAAHQDAPTTLTSKGINAAELRSRYGLPRRSFARVLGVSERTLADLETGKTPTEPVRRRLVEADRLHRALATVIQADALGPWLDAPNDAFGGLKPIELIERGESDRLWRMLFELRSGNPF